MASTVAKAVIGSKVKGLTADVEGECTISCPISFQLSLKVRNN